MIKETELYKLAENVLTELFAEKKEDSGTNLVKQIKYAKSEFDISSAFNSAVIRVLRKFKKIKTKDPESMLSGIGLHKIIINDNSILLVIKVVNKTRNGILVTSPYIELPCRTEYV